MQRPIYSRFRDSWAHSADAQSAPFTSSLFLRRVHADVPGFVNLPVFGRAGSCTQEAFAGKHLQLLYVACVSGANTRVRRHTCEHGGRQIRTCMRTQSAFMAGGNNIVALLRGQPQFCGQRGYIQEMLLLYMFITLPWKNKRLSHRHFLRSSLPGRFSEPVWEGGGERLDEG